ncbi:hypothetical protein GN958_ATG02158 [Phytophthora infestans]|uniref:Secreted protein n=1 Tax=Phytophthora infestans TaxID=4787 RepID=A0A8S9VDI9_PHYIN|nr:hypothetical protein GN958_ATG02158 [Phytophthora infestans]
MNNVRYVAPCSVLLLSSLLDESACSGPSSPDLAKLLFLFLFVTGASPVDIQISMNRQNENFVTYLLVTPAFGDASLGGGRIWEVLAGDALAVNVPKHQYHAGFHVLLTEMQAFARDLDDDFLDNDLVNGFLAGDLDDDLFFAGGLCTDKQCSAVGGSCAVAAFAASTAAEARTLSIAGCWHTAHATHVIITQTTQQYTNHLTCHSVVHHSLLPMDEVDANSVTGITTSRMYFRRVSIPRVGGRIGRPSHFLELRPDNTEVVCPALFLRYCRRVFTWSAATRSHHR